MYDIIGDIHGHADELVTLLEQLGYREQNACFRHPSRKVIFCGDFVDRGPHIPDVVRIARKMVEQDAALAVMGSVRPAPPWPIISEIPPVSVARTGVPWAIASAMTIGVQSPRVGRIKRCARA